MLSFGRDPAGHVEVIDRAQQLGRDDVIAPADVASDLEALYSPLGFDAHGDGLELHLLASHQARSRPTSGRHVSANGELGQRSCHLDPHRAVRMRRDGVEGSSLNNTVVEIEASGTGSIGFKGRLHVEVA
jgi:hypothetical protein